MSDLYKAFHEHFEIVIADTASLKETVFRMRYQKLCIEMNVPGYEPSLYPDKRCYRHRLDRLYHYRTTRTHS